jgi:hypothetical protein
MRFRPWWLFIAGLLLLSLGVLRPTPASAGRSGTYSGIAGEWSGHGFELTIGADGQAVAQWREYQWCSDLSGPDPCDSIVGNEIYSGGLAMLRFTSLTSMSANAMVLMTSDPSDLALGQEISLAILPGGVARIQGLGSSGSASLTLCGPSFDPTQFQNSPCGA